MAFWDRVFERYRNQNKGRHVHSDPNQHPDKFGIAAMQKNPNLKVFDNAQNNIAEIIDRRSVVSQFETQTQISEAGSYFSSLFSGVNAMPLYTNKGERIKQYRAMAAYPECDFCLTELADDTIHQDETGDFIKLNIPEDKTHLTEDRRKTLQIQFDKFISLFRLKEDGYKYVKRFLTEGELTFENIINPQKPELGIIGVKFLPAEYCETIINMENGQQMGILFDKEKLTRDLKTIISNSCLGSRAIFNNTITTQANFFQDRENSIPLLYPQLTYISSNETSPDEKMVFPLVEKCKMAYHQLALMQDAAVILRVTRAPERLLFNISTGGLPDKQARQKVMQFMNDLKSKKIVTSHVDSNAGSREQDVRSVYNPVSMLESYFFGKSNANDGTTVESVGSSADYEQIADIEYFLRRLFKQFKVAFSRYKTPENSLERDDTITYEEYAMGRQIIKIQRRIALGLTRSFITHLKLLGLWKKFDLKESDFSIDFVAPIMYDLYHQQKIINAKMTTYKEVVDQEEFSKIIAMRKILHMSDEEIEDNFKMLIKEKQLVAVADYMADKISDENQPLDYPSPIRLSGEEKEDDNGGGDDGGDNGGGGDGGEPGGDEPPAPEAAPEGGEDQGGEEAPAFGLGN